MALTAGRAVLDGPSLPAGPVRPFRIEVADDVLEDLQRRLRAHRSPRFPLDAPDLGIDLAVLADVVAHWRDGFDWRAVERELNRFDQVLVEVGGLDVHAVHVRGDGPRPLPLLIGHGWPSSFVEILPVIDLLTRPGDFGGDPADAFHVVAPSLTGYAWSSPPQVLSDVTAACMGRRFHALMRALGYERYGASGGDIGARVAVWLGAQVPESIVAAHVSCNAISPPEGEDRSALTDPERAWLEREASWWEREGGYEHIQRTKPRTVAVALGDSPVATAAWLIEKWSSWAQTDGDPIGRLGIDQLLTHAMLHWTAGSMGTSCLTYTAFRLAPGPRPPAGAVTAPVGFYLSQAEPHGIPPRSFAERQYDVSRWSVIPRGGHFLPAEEPELFAQDVREFFRPLRRTINRQERG